MQALTLDPVKQPLLALTAWIVRGHNPATGAQYTGTSWGRTEAEARARHDRLHAADRRRRAETGALDAGIDLDGYQFTYTPVPLAY